VHILVVGLQVRNLLVDIAEDDGADAPNQTDGGYYCRQTEPQHRPPVIVGSHHVRLVRMAAAGLGPLKSLSET
jgi:hypothetical protein